MKIFLIMLLAIAPAYSQSSIWVDKLATHCKGKVVAVVNSPLEDQLTYFFIKDKRCKVVERKLIDRVIKELEFQHTGYVNPYTAKRIGRFLGADYIVTGTLNEAKLISTETAEVIAMESYYLRDETPPNDQSAYEDLRIRRMEEVKRSIRIKDDGSFIWKNKVYRPSEINRAILKYVEGN